MSTFGKKQEKETPPGPQPIFCKKCGRKIPAGGKFCSACGTPVRASGQEPDHNTTGTPKSPRKPGSTAPGNGSPKPFKPSYIGIASVVILLLIGIVIFTRRSGSSGETAPDKEQSVASNTTEAVSEESEEADTDEPDSLDNDSSDVPGSTDDEDADESDDASDREAAMPEKDSPGFHKEVYKNLPVSEKQVKELEEVYHTAYEDEEKALESYIAEYAKECSEYGDLTESFQQMSGITEEFYQALNAYDPELKNVIAADAGTRFGNGVLGSYLVAKGVGTVLADDELGRELRSVIETVAFTGLEALMIWDAENAKNGVRSDAMTPLAASGDYALVQSYGTVWNMLEELKYNSGCSIAEKALEMRQEMLEEMDDRQLEDYWTEDMDALFETYQKSENYSARMDAIAAKRKEWETKLNQWRQELLEKVGFENPEHILEAGFPDDEKWTDKVMLEYFDISDKEYEKLKKECGADSVNDVMEQTQKDSSWDGFDEYMDAKWQERQQTQEEITAALNQHVYSIIDKEGKVYASFLIPSGEVDAVINEKGTCSVWQGPAYGDADSFPHVIIDTEGTLLYENSTDSQEKYIYYPVSQSGNVLKKTFFSDFDHGDYQVLEYIGPDGTSEKLMEGGFISIEPMEEGCTDYFAYSCGYEDDRSAVEAGIIDMASGSLLTEDEYAEKTAERIIQGQEIDMRTLDPENTSLGIWLNENYILCDSKIFDTSGKVVKELSEGRGVQDIRYTDGQYWVITESGWYYILDDDFNQILEPVDLNGSVCTITDWGILANELYESNGEENSQPFTCLYDASGNVTKLFEQRNNYQLEGFLLHDENIGGGENMGGINLYTKEPVLIEIPETPIRLDF